MCFNKLLLSTETICSGGVLNTCIVSLTILVSRSDTYLLAIFTAAGAAVGQLLDAYIFCN